ncbi:putative transcriptional regulator [Rhodococcus sp. AW25M09]|nr:putative transcriptional regulator [Rhodococcus sp. AW25M09]
MYDEHVTRDQRGGPTAHLSAVDDAPQTESDNGAGSSVTFDAGSAYVARTTDAETDVEEMDSDSDAADPVSGDPDADMMPFVAESVPPSKPFLSLVAGFDEMFEEIEDQWQERALCAQTDPEAFFPEKGGSTREAKRICLGCEVKDECLEYALANDERFGIWGGLSERERRRLKRGIG